MIQDLEKSYIAEKSTDIAVIGSGPIGIMVAVALARAGRKVALCECGGETPNLSTQALNDADVVGRKHLGVKEGRARLLGGTSTLWGGQLVAFREIDFKAREWLGVDDWPIQHADIAPYFEKAAHMLGLPTIDDNEEVVWRQLGAKKPDFGPEIQMILTRWLKQPNLARMFEQDLKHNPAIEVLLHACAVGFESTGSSISCAHLRTPSGKTSKLYAKTIVLACGTIEASRLMLASAYDNRQLPWVGNRWIGRGFQDHLDMRAATVEPFDRKAFDDIFDNIFLKGFKYNPKLQLSSLIQEECGITNVAAAMMYESSLSEHLSNIKIFIKALRNGVLPPNLFEIFSHFRALTAIWWPLIVRYLKDNRLFNPGDLGIGLRVHCEQRPLESSSITIRPDDRDAFGLPRCVLDWRVDGCEIETIAVLCEKVKVKMEAMGLARVTIDPDVLARDPATLTNAQDTNHHCGGLRMGAGIEDGVVDRNARVFGTENMYVAGAAIFRSSSFANPTYTAMALALRLVDHLLEQAV